MNIEQEIQNILDRNFTRGDNAKALKELLVLYNVVGRSEQLKCEKCGAYFIPHLMKPLTICDKCADSFAL
jgi:formylmethanofuran dehydrogenase subunit E